MPEQDTRRLASMLSTLEDRYANLNRKIEVIESNMLKTDKRLLQETKLLTSEIAELKRELTELKDKLMLVAKELKNLASKTELETLKKTVEFFDPMQFVTRNEVERIVKEKMEEKKLSSK